MPDWMNTERMKPKLKLRQPWMNQLNAEWSWWMKWWNSQEKISE